VSDGTETVTALARGLALLDVLGRSGRAMSLAELARASEMHKTTTLRLLDTLRQGGYVQRTGIRYELGGAAFTLGLSYQRTRLFHVVRPTLIELLVEQYDNPSFHMRYSVDARVCVLHARKCDGEHECVPGGTILPLEKGAPSRVLKAFEEGPPSNRKVGLIVSRGERVPKHVGISAPVFGPDDRLWGALAVCGPQEHFTHPFLSRSCKRIIGAAAALTAKLGGDPTIFEDVEMLQDAASV
jgi:DNA-binding IclR family transcriptional regulator